MARSLAVTYGNKVIYHIQFTDSFANLSGELKKIGSSPERKICIVTDSNVGPLYAEAVANALKSEYPHLLIHTFEAGEEHKNLDTVNRLYETLIRNHFDRKDLLIALGGGVVGDLTGFTAATYLRGIDFIQVPTTLLSQVDSSIGGKTGVDFMQYKNMVGAFYQPKLVYMNLSTLSTLPRQQLVSGMGEVLKHGLIKDRAFFFWIKEHEAELQNLQMEALEEMIFRSCNIKREVVERDPREKGERALLNFGHTIGHAIETLSDFNLFHGECVGLGMVAASYLSMQLGNISSEEFRMVKETLVRFHLPTEVSGYDPAAVLAATKSDKKMEGSRVKFILLKEIGDAYIDRNLSEEQILDAISCVCRQPQET